MTKKTSNKTTLIDRLQSWLAVFKTNVIASCTDLHYYVQTLNFSLRKSIKLVLSFYLIVAVVQVVRLVTIDLPVFEENLRAVSDQLTMAFSSDTQLIWDGHTLNTLPPQTIEIPFSSDSSEDQMPEHWLKIDTQNGERTGDTLFFINKDTLFASQLDGDTQEIPLTSFLGSEAQTFTRSSLQQDANSLLTTFAELKPIIPIGAFVPFWFGTFLIRVIMIAIDSILIYFLFQLMQRPLPYKKVFQLSLHTLIPIEIIHQITLLLYPNSTVPMISLSYWIIMMCLIWQFRKLRVIRITSSERDHKQS